MGLTVYAENMGLFHKGSGGKGIAPFDVCLSPPPPPAGPVPIPYVNALSAADLSKGSKTVKVDGEPTALEDASYVSTSKGDEAGTQGGSVITRKTKGKGYFKVWSFTVQVEGKGVCRHGDPIGQNCASMPPSCVNLAAMVKFNKSLANTKPCEEEYSRNKGNFGPKQHGAQRDTVRGGPCWQCGATKSGRADDMNFTPDHQPPLSVAWNMGGCHDHKKPPSPTKFEEWANSAGAVVPHCKKCSDSQSCLKGNEFADDVRSWMDTANSGSDISKQRIEYDTSAIKTVRDKLITPETKQKILQQLNQLRNTLT